MAVRLAIYNHKGGVGKSTTSVMLADGLASIFGLRILFLDFDRQATSSKILLGIDGLAHAVKEERTLANALYALAQNSDAQLSTYLCTKASDLIELRDAQDLRRIDLIPSSIALLTTQSNIEDNLLDLYPGMPLDVIFENLIGKRLKRLEGSYDAIIIDCPAGLSPLALAAVRSADHVIAPTVLEENSLTALSDFLHIILSDRFSLSERLQVHILMTQFVASNTMQKEILGHIQQGLYKLNAVMRPIPHSTAIQRAMLHPGRGNFRRLNEKYGNALSDVNALAKAIGDRMRKKRTK